MDKTVLRRLSRLEAQTLSVDGVGLLELQTDGSWILIENGRTTGQYATQEEGSVAFRGEHLIIIDV